jgi:hypothetical protein
LPADGIRQAYQAVYAIGDGSDFLPVHPEALDDRARQPAGFGPPHVYRVRARYRIYTFDEAPRDRPEGRVFFRRAQSRHLNRRSSYFMGVYRIHSACPPMDY